MTVKVNIKFQGDSFFFPLSTLILQVTAYCLLGGFEMSTVHLTVIPLFLRGNLYSEVGVYFSHLCLCTFTKCI